MLFEVTRIYLAGEKLDKAAIKTAPSLVGQLHIEEWGNTTNVEKRNLLYADLKTIAKSGFPAHKLLPRLFEPRIIKMTDRWFLLEGWENDTGADGKVRAFRQGWIVRFASPGK